MSNWRVLTPSHRTRKSLYPSLSVQTAGRWPQNRHCTALKIMLALNGGPGGAAALPILRPQRLHTCHLLTSHNHSQMLFESLDLNMSYYCMFLVVIPIIFKKCNTINNHKLDSYPNSYQLHGSVQQKPPPEDYFCCAAK